MEFVSWNPIRKIRSYRERRHRLREEERILQDEMKMIQFEEERAVRNPMGLRRRRRVRVEEEEEKENGEEEEEEEEEEIIVRINKPRWRIRGVFTIMKRSPRLEYVAFLGIPYAKPPVGKRRFQPPERLSQLPRGKPTPLLKAHDGWHPCAQTARNKDKGSENCLYLNVYTPGKPKDIRELLPVLVYIHGGGFQAGSNYSSDPDDLMREDLILVIPNYRLNIFGFLNMRSENCRGNAGLKDQVMALEWVQDNIKKFKGNPDNVTICGQSAGGSCVNFHMLSPLSKGLFHQAIVMAGGVHCSWGFEGHAKHVKHLFKRALGQSNELRQVVVNSLKRVKTFDLLKMGNQVICRYLALTPRKMTVAFKPSVEYLKEGAFLPDTVENLMAIAEPVPTIAGITKQEGYQYFRVHKATMTKLVNKEVKFKVLLKEIIQHKFDWKDPNAVERHFEFFKTTYFPGDAMLDNANEEADTPTTVKEKLRREKEQERKEEERKERLATLATDLYFWRFYDNFKIGNLLSDNDWPPFYVYEFDYFAGRPLIPMLTLKDNYHNYKRPVIIPTAAEHCDDVYFLLRPEILDDLLRNTAVEDRDRVELEIKGVKMNMRYLWSSFCRTGVPKTSLQLDAHINWLHHTEENPRYLHIGKRLTLEYKRLNEERWSELNRICQLESTISSLAQSPQTPDKEFKLLQLLQSLPGPSTSQTPDTEYDLFEHLVQPEPGDRSRSTSQSSVEEEEYEST